PPVLRCQARSGERALTSQTIGRPPRWTCVSRSWRPPSTASCRRASNPTTTCHWTFFRLAAGPSTTSVTVLSRTRVMLRLNGGEHRPPHQGMEEVMTNVRLAGTRVVWVALAVLVAVAVLGARFAIATHAAEPGEDTGGIHVELSALAGAPDAKGSA